MGANVLFYCPDNFLYIILVSVITVFFALFHLWVQLFYFTPQALHFGYAYQDNFPDLKSKVEINKDNFDELNQEFENKVAEALSAMESFISMYYTISIHI